MTAFHLTIFWTSVTLLLLGLCAGRMKRVWWFSEPLVAILVGVLVGPCVLGWLDLRVLGDEHAILEQAARLTIAVSVVSAALRLPRGFMWRARGVWLALGPGMLAMWAVATLAVWGVLRVDFWLAALVGAIVTPTDPVLAGAIVTSRLAKERLPERLRALLSGESAANDGLAYPLVLLPVLMREHPAGAAIGLWLGDVWLWRVVAAVAAGAAIGGIAGLVLGWAARRGLMTESSEPTASIALAIVAVSLVKLMGSDGILAAFVAALMLKNCAPSEATEGNLSFHESAQRFFEYPVFVLFGLALPLGGWVEEGWPLGLLVAAVLLLRRLPFFLLVRRANPQTPRPADVWFAGWFGPVGVAALYYAMLALHHGQPELVWHAASAVIAGSALVHGLTATPATRRYPAE